MKVHKMAEKGSKYARKKARIAEAKKAQEQAVSAGNEKFLDVIYNDVDYVKVFQSLSLLDQIKAYRTLKRLMEGLNKTDLSESDKLLGKMAEYKLGQIETIFADMIWDNEPVTSRRLTELAADHLNWKRTTTYTILKRLCDRGLFQNEGGTVTSLVSREEFYARQSEIFVEETFHGSLPAFLSAFGSRKKLSDSEIDELQKVIDAMKGGSHG